LEKPSKDVQTPSDAHQNPSKPARNGRKFSPKIPKTTYFSRITTKTSIHPPSFLLYRKNFSYTSNILVTTGQILTKKNKPKHVEETNAQTF